MLMRTFKLARLIVLQHANNDDVAFGNAGSSYVAADFNGDIDDIKIYNYTRNVSQITEDMNAEHPIGS